MIKHLCRYTSNQQASVYILMIIKAPAEQHAGVREPYI